MTITLAKSAGFCFGVSRAVKICEKAAESGPCYTLGPIIHNTDVIRYLEGLGVRQLDSVESVKPGDRVVIRSHGISRAEWERLRSAGAQILDATCPDVARIHRIVEEESAQGRQIVIIGDKNHPEVQAIAGWCRDPLVFSGPKEIEFWIEAETNIVDLPISVVSQTTGTRVLFENSVNTFKKVCTKLKIFDTICNATSRRQDEAASLAKQSDAMIVIGGRHSANSIHLCDICRAHCARVHFIENADMLNRDEFSREDNIGITAGASTPAWIIKEVNQKMSDEIKVESSVAENEAAVAEEAAETVEAVENAAAEPVESFEEMLERSIKTLYTGEKVTGIVAAITPTEITVDLGTKQSGYIPITELTDDPTKSVEDIVKPGDEIETYVMRVNDVEGTVMLSKKRLDSVKNWDDIETARAEKTVVEGTVVEDNKGGVVVNVRGIRVFVPASQTGLAKDVPMTELLKQKVRLRITEVNQSRRRVVGSIRAVQYEERRAKAEQIWNEIEEGKKYTGVVKSMTSYGAFVDIGGIDGMVHVSELSWTRIKQPSDVLSIGQEIEVYVLSFDKEKKKISLGYKTEETNPWNKFISEYHIGDIIPVKIVKLMPFGAFAEILPGVDGLIHISQIADRRIGMPSEVLSEGQEVKVKITDIDTERHKVSLSIRALLEEPVPAPDAATAENEVVYDSEAPVEEAPVEEAPAEEAPVEETPAE